MSCTISVNAWGLPGTHAPDKRHPHLPYWFDMTIEAAPPTPLQAFMRLGLAMMFPFARPVDEAAQERATVENTARFTARRMGLKENATFGLLPLGPHSLRLAFASLEGWSRYTQGMNRLDQPYLPTASNDPDYTRAAPTAPAILPGGHIASPTPGTARLLPIERGHVPLSNINPAKAANARHY